MLLSQSILCLFFSIRISPDDLKDNEKQDDSSKLSTAMIDGDDDDDDDDDENGSLINVTPHGEG